MSSCHPCLLETSLSSSFCWAETPDHKSSVTHRIMHAHCFSWAHMCTVLDNLLVYGGIQIVLCVWACVCVWFLSMPLAFLCTFHTFLQDLSHTNACLLFCYESSVIWPAAPWERERERETASLCSVFAEETPVDCTMRHNAQMGHVKVVCAACADWKSSFNSLGLTPHTVTTPQSTLQGFLFTIDRCWEWKNYLLQLFKLLWFFSGH